jgi:hypothetical protein
MTRRSWMLGMFRHPIALAALALLLGLCPSGAAGQAPPPPQPAAAGETAAEAPPQPALPLYEQDPYDEIRFSDGTSVKIVRLPLDPRKTPERPNLGGRKLKVRLLEKPDEEYEAEWKDIEEVVLWEQLVLNAAVALVNEGKIDEAYPFFDFLLLQYPDWPGVAEAMERFLFEDAKARRRQGQHDYELALLKELHRRNPARDGLSEALGTVTQSLIEPQYAAQEYAAVRRLLKGLAGMYGSHPVVTEWSRRLMDEAAVLVAQARTDVEAGRLREAFGSANRAVQIWPALGEARQALTEIQQQYPRVLVGVGLPAGPVLTDRLDDWASRRTRRLVARTLLEFRGHGPQGGEYASPYGRLSKHDLDLTLLFELKPNIRWPGDAGVVAAHDVARLALAMTDPKRACYREDWAALFRRVTVYDVFEVEIELRRPHVRPEAILQQVLRQGEYPLVATAANELPVGPYAPEAGTSGIFLANQDYFAHLPTQPREVVERHYDNARDALLALRRGEVTVLDRVAPWDARRLREEPDIALQEYAVPTVHCLVFNPDNPFLANRTFRRALVYGLPRDLILSQQLLQGATIEGTRAVSGPFAAGRTPDDPMGYAYNDQVPYRPYDPRLAITLAQLSLSNVNAQRQKNGLDALAEVPPLVLALPPHDVARVACRAIVQYYAQLKVPVTLVELPADPAAPAPACDLRYCEVAMWEPIADARRLLGTGGLVGRASPYLDLALRQLDAADSWKSARETLAEIHRLVAEEVAIIPLWQLTDYFAHRKDVSGLGERPVTLYQQIEQWQVKPWFPPDE